MGTIGRKVKPHLAVIMNEVLRPPELENRLEDLQHEHLKVMQVEAGYKQFSRIADHSSIT